MPASSTEPLYSCHAAVVVMTKSITGILTSDEHDAYREDLLRVGVRRNVAKSYGSEAAEREVESGDVLGPDRRTAGIVAGKRISLLRLHSQLVKPTDRLRQIGSLVVADGVPDAGEPVSDENERGHQQQKHGGTVLRVAIQLASDTHQAQ